MTIESKVANAILQTGEEVEIGGRKYIVTPPTPATLIMVSEQLSEITVMSGENVLQEVLLKSKDAKALGKVAATLILGAKRIRENRRIRKGLFLRITELEWVAERLLEDITIQDLALLLSKRLSQMQIGDFFAITTSLLGASITKPTKEVETAFGERS